MSRPFLTIVRSPETTRRLAEHDKRVNLYNALAAEQSPASRGAQSPVGQSPDAGARKSGTLFDSGWIGVALMMLTAMLIGCWFAVGHS